ncbi:hypothetical protein EDC01DRAFT_193083 [Geopyxis carbonaria]|nr:hypothetical protein EDC01DRAFT_193083 [Geopyxis carbonaria]
MFSRTAFTTLRCARTGSSTPLKSNLRRYATAPEPKSSSSGLFVGIGALAAAAAGGYYYYTTTSVAAPLPPAIPTLTGDGSWIDLPLTHSEQLSSNTKLLRFALPTPDHVSGMSVASCLLTKYKGPNDAKPTIRPYTPISDVDQRGHMDLIVKAYPNGPMSTHMHEMAPEQRLAFKGPLVKYAWEANKHDHVAFIAGGTGITPMYQIAKAIFSNPEDKTKVTLVFGNLSEKDILLKKEWEVLENTYPQRCKVFYVLDKAPEGSGWATEGRVTKELLKTVLPEPGSGNNKIFVCGPPGMYKAISGTKKSPSDQGELAGMLKELGYKKEDVFKF